MSEQIESALHCGGMAPSFENEVEYYRRRVAELEQRVRELEAFRDEAVPYMRHNRGCKINPGGKIMASLGYPDPHPCTCGLDALLAKAGKAQGEGAQAS